MGRVDEVEGREEDKGANVLQLDEESGAIKGHRLFPPTDGSRSVIVASNNLSLSRESAVFAEAAQATGLTTLELRRDPHLLWRRDPHLKI